MSETAVVQGTGPDSEASIRHNAARHGFLPIPLRSVPCDAFEGIAVYLRRTDLKPGDEPYVLYRNAELAFTEEDRKRLTRGGVGVVYIRIADHGTFRRRTETLLSGMVVDPQRSLAEKAEIVYEIGLELINDVLQDTDLSVQSERIANVSRCVATLVLSNDDAFSHLFATSHHDFYTATHMINVGTWVVPLAFAMGYRDQDRLSEICQAGMLHDIGKVFVAPELLNKVDPLTDEEWARIRHHPERGWEHLNLFDAIPALVREVCRQHHERMDGSGYPDGLQGDEIHDVSRMCAIVDAFDAMTAVRPFKDSSLSVSEALIRIKSESPSKFDPDVVTAWLGLMSRVSDRDLGTQGAVDDAPDGRPIEHERRRHKRFRCDCVARVEVLREIHNKGWETEAIIKMKVVNISRFGMGLVSPKPVEPGRRMRIRMDGFGAQGQTAKVVEATSVRCREMDSGTFEIGVELKPLARPR